jgi:hypothetical protein
MYIYTHINTYRYRCIPVCALSAPIISTRWLFMHLLFFFKNSSSFSSFIYFSSILLFIYVLSLILWSIFIILWSFELALSISISIQVLRCKFSLILYSSIFLCRFLMTVWIWIHKYVYIYINSCKYVCICTYIYINVHR